LSCSYYLYRLRKHVSYGFPITNFCNTGVHYEKPCINLSCNVDQQNAAMLNVFDISQLNLTEMHSVGLHYRGAYKEGNKLGSMSGTCAVSTISRRELS